MTGPLISIIVPVYNVSSYLPRCIDSILAQTYDNFELYLVDDGSTDESGRLCDEAAGKDQRIKVIHKPNGGQSSARNMALDVMSGEYVTFADSDDYLDAGYLEYLYGLLRNNDAEISISAHYYVDEEGKETGRSGSKTELMTFTGVEAVRDQCYQKNVDNFVWGKLYKAELFDDVRFPEGKIYEELGTNYRLYLKCSKIVLGNGSFYRYVQRKGSTMHIEYSSRKMDRIDMSETLLNDIGDISDELRRAGECRLFVSAVQVLREFPDNIEGHEQEFERIKTIIDTYKKSVFHDPDAKKINRIIAGTVCVIGAKSLKKLGSLYKMVYPN